jgi:hypothetical protein
MAGQGLLHIARAGYPRGQKVHTLCGLWTTVRAGNYVGSDGGAARHKHLCPACKRRDEGGK